MKNKILAIILLLFCSHVFALELRPNIDVGPLEVLEKALCYQGSEKKPRQIDKKKWSPCSEKNYSNWESGALWNKIEINYTDTVSSSFIAQRLIATEDTVSVWIYNGDSLLISGISGSGVPLDKRLLETRSVAFPIDLENPGKYEFYLRGQTHGKFLPPPTIVTLKTFNERRKEGRLVMYPYIGAGIAVFLINLLMFFVLRLKVYKPYIIFHFLLVSLTIIITGHSINYLPAIDKGWAFFISPILGMVGLSLVWFTSHYFDEKIFKTPLLWVLSLLAASNFVTFALGLPMIFTQELLFVMTLSLLVYSLVKAHQGSKKAVFYAVSWGGYSVFVLIYVLTKNSVLPDYFFFKYGAIFAHIWEMSFFTVAIANLLITRLKNTQAEVLKSEESKSRLLQQISHQLRTPMTGILGEVEVLTTEKKVNNLQGLVHNSYVLEHTLNNIIDSIDYLPSSPTLNETFVPIENNLEGIVYQLSLEYSGKIKTCSVEPSSFESKVDWVLYRKFIYQFLDNALKYGEENSVEILADLKEGMFCFQVLNRSIDDPTERLNVQQEFSLRQKGVGVGLGFQIAQKVVSDLKGKLDYSYKEGQFKIKVVIPISETRAIEENEFSCVDEDVLVVDDNKMNRKILGKLASKLDMKAEYSVNGFDGVKKFIRNRPKVIFMDIQMPIMDGLSATKAIRKYEEKKGLEPSIILAITAHGAHSYESVCKEAGVDVMLSKPVKLDVLKIALGVA